MEKGTIAQIRVYFDGPESPWRAEFRKAETEFFAGLSQLVLPLATPLFNEWFLFDYRLPNGRSPLEEFVGVNPYYLDEADLATVRGLEQNRFSLFTVEKIRIGKGLILHDVLDHDREYAIQEKSLTYQVKKGDFVATRVAPIGDHWEFVGADGPRPDKKMAADIIGAMAGKADEFDPRKMLELFFPLTKGEKASVRDFEKMAMSVDGVGKIDADDARRRLDEALEQTGLARMVDAETVEDWFRHASEGEETVPMSAILGILGEDTTPAQINALIGAVQDLGNATPRTALDRPAPQEARLDGRKPDIKLSCQRGGMSLIVGVAEAASRAMQKGDYATARRLFANCFEILLENRATMREPWRLYANYAVTLAATGNLDLAEEMNEIGLDLNPNYDFGLDTADRLAAERKRLRLRRKRAALADTLENDPAAVYDCYLTWLGIDFSTPDLTTSERTDCPLVPKRKKR